MALIQADFLQGWIKQSGLEPVASILKIWLVAEWRPARQKSAHDPTGTWNSVIFMKNVDSGNSSWGQKQKKLINNPTSP